MISASDLVTVHDFLKQTGEPNVRKMMKEISPVHVGLLMKLVHICKDSEFAEHCEKNTFPKFKLNRSEEKIKENFWNDCCKAFISKGLASNQQAA
ncbi:MAG: hypothetical protein KDD37_03655 [Bdellovibrionales bacterium]|nr:hypothetical protein [Bdellovibrionales bacterium]